MRGPGPGKRHNARTIAALTGNPGCTRRAVLDAAGIDKPKLAQHIGFPGNFGQSRFALARGNAFESMLKADGCALLLETLGYASTAPIRYDDLGEDADDTLGARYARTRGLLAGSTETTLIDHPLLTLDVAGQTVFLEPDLIAFRIEGRLQVVEIKSFAIVDGQADSAKVSAAATQAAVYVLALRRLLSGLGVDEQSVSYDVVLVCPENFSLRPAAVVLDVRKQLSTLRRQLTRLASVADIVAALPPDLTFDLALPPAELTAASVPGRSPLRARVPRRVRTRRLLPRTRPRAPRLRWAARSVMLSAASRRWRRLLALAAGTRTPTEEQAEAAALLRAATRLRAEALSG